MALLLREDDVCRLLTMDKALKAVEDAFRTVAHGDAVTIAGRRGALPGVTLSMVGAISRSLDLAGVKCYLIARRDVTVGSTFTMLLYRISTGALAAVLEAGALGQIRAGAAGKRGFAWCGIAAGFDWSTVQPLSHVVAGIVAGRSSPQEITLFESQGLGLDDVAAASRVLELAPERGIGMEIWIR